MLKLKNLRNVLPMVMYKFFYSRYHRLINIVVVGYQFFFFEFCGAKLFLPIDFHLFLIKKIMCERKKNFVRFSTYILTLSLLDF